MNKFGLERWMEVVIDAHRAGGPITDAILQGCIDAQRELEKAWKNLGEQRAVAKYRRGNLGGHYEGWSLGTCPCIACESYRNKNGGEPKKDGRGA